MSQTRQRSAVTSIWRVSVAGGAHLPSGSCLTAAELVVLLGRWWTGDD